MVSFRNCVFVILFFTLISFLAFFPAGNRQGRAEKTISADADSALSPIPQKAECGGEHKSSSNSHSHDTRPYSQ